MNCCRLTNFLPTYFDFVILRINNADLWKFFFVQFLFKLVFFDKQASLRDLFSSSSANGFGSVQENVASDDREKSMSLSTKQVEEVRPSIIIL